MLPFIIDFHKEEFISFSTESRLYKLPKKAIFHHEDVIRAIFWNQIIDTSQFIGDKIVETKATEVRDGGTSH